jgi:hypothetical protein
VTRHPLDPVALVAGLTALIAGFTALLHQSGTISLDLATVVLMGLVVLGLGGAALVVLDLRRR